MNKRNKRGFTIVELVIVIAIIGVLSAILIPTFAGLLNSAREAADTQMVRNLNNVLAADASVNGKHETAYDAIKVANESGYSVEKLTPTSLDYDVVWDKTTDRFILVSGNEYKYFDQTTTPSTNKYDLWKIYKEVPSVDEQTYSIYLTGSKETKTVEIKGVGFDAGENLGITEVKYTGSENGVNVSIRTNIYDTIITIDTANDIVNHYGKANNVIVKDTVNYNEYGNLLSSITVENGHVVLENNSSASAIVIDTTADKISNGEVIISVDNTTAPKTPIIVASDVKEAIENNSGNKNGITSAENSLICFEPGSDAVIGNTSYTSLSKAIAANSNGETIFILKDQKISSSSTIYKKDITIDLLNHTLTTCEDAFYLYGGSMAIFKNGKIEHKDSWEPIYSYGNNKVIIDNMTIDTLKYALYADESGSVTISNSTLMSESASNIYFNAHDENCELNISNCTLKNGTNEPGCKDALLQLTGKTTLKDVKIDSVTCAIAMFGNSNLTIDGSETYIRGSQCLATNGVNTDYTGITINNGKFVTSSEDGIAIYHPAECILTINNGYFEGGTALYAKSGNVTINGGTFVGKGEKINWKYNANGASSTGDAVVFEACNYGGNSNPSVTIDGGTFISENNAGIRVINVNGNKVILTNKTNFDPVIEETTSSI